MPHRFISRRIFLTALACGLAAAAQAQAPEQATQQATLAQQPDTAKRTQVRLCCGCGRTGAEPLYVIDGQHYTQARLLTLNPQEIQAIEIVKGEAAVTRYGSPGANGVVVITMKSGTRRAASKKVGFFRRKS